MLFDELRSWAIMERLNMDKLRRHYIYIYMYHYLDIYKKLNISPHNCASIALGSQLHSLRKCFVTNSNSDVYFQFFSYSIISQFEQFGVTMYKLISYVLMKHTDQRKSIGVNLEKNQKGRGPNCPPVRVMSLLECTEN